MKKIILILIVIIYHLPCQAQTPVKSLYDDDYGEITGAYYKDTHNDFNNYEGTWVYTNGATELTIILQKRLMEHFIVGNYDFYEDVLVGEYKYIENGVEEINSLSQISAALPSAYHHYICGSAIVGPQSYYCKNCGPTDRKVILGFSEPSRRIMGMEPEMIFERADSNGTQKLKLTFRSISGPIAYDGQSQQYTSYSIPFGEYILVKQP